ncbi:VOC family protein [Curtobacterium sp. MCPF17_047]|uniref:VOC family protein n=1 Tax=unclassified Curtobacterium TaxID=257496 RepID=UPI000DA73A73|nr:MULTISPECIES: VOC family protein [unclassified Curtobacterium]PZE58853.1 VOC family protein [Curtobacterium sp. MCPF17_001]PZF69075.1 VOC family protein [Curtobacterium sp. MCPF17_047]
MTITTIPHVNFDGQAAAALAFWGAALGTEPVVVTYGQSGAVEDPAWADRVVWGQVTSASGVRVMAFDVWPGQPYDQGTNSSYVYLSGTDEDEIRAVWAGLQEGAEVRQPLGPSAWSPLAGQLRDRFGVVWALDVPAAQQH